MTDRLRGDCGFFPSGTCTARISIRVEMAEVIILPTLCCCGGSFDVGFSKYGVGYGVSARLWNSFVSGYGALSTSETLKETSLEMWL